MINFDESFFVGLSVILFVGIIFFPIKKMMRNFIDNRVEEIKLRLEEAERLKKEAEALLATYLAKQQEIQEDIKKLTENAEHEIRVINENAEKQLNLTLKQKSEQAMQRISQYESTMMNEVRVQAVEIAFIAVRTIIRERMSLQDSERLINTVIDDLDNRLN